MKYLELKFIFPENDQAGAEILMAQLIAAGFDSFEEEDSRLKAYIEKSKFKDSILKNVPYLSGEKGEKILIEISDLEDKNWNEEWEKEFTPITIGSDCHIRATFHEPVEGIKYDILIDPKMSFGTGHHQTTRLMIRMMLGRDFRNKTVLDMGCGTGILAILASKMGATEVTAIDIDEWAYRNTMENIDLNSITNVKTIMGDAKNAEGKHYNLILANITRNILLADMSIYRDCLTTGGYILFSGFYNEDYNLVREEAERNGLKAIDHISEDNWAGATFIKNKP